MALLQSRSPDGTTAQPVDFDRGTSMAIAAFTAVAWYNVAELNVQVFMTFKRRRGLYFWSLILSSYGCALHALGFLLKFFLTQEIYLSVSIFTVGWYFMVTGQAVVLYSRLHLVVREQRVLTGILAMIIIDAIVFHIPTTILTYWSNSPKPQAPVLDAFNIYEKLQMTAFCIQEFIISGVYVWATISLLRPVYHGRTRKVMIQLIWINLIIIGMDVCLLAMEYSRNYEIEATLKAMVYSIKLKLEFAVLNQLMSLANSSVNNHQNLHIENEKPEKPMPGRSKSTEYISQKYRKPNKYPERPNLHQTISTGLKPRPSSHTAHRQHSSLKQHHQHQERIQWGSDVGQQTGREYGALPPGKEDGQINVITNPAAYYSRSRRRSPEEKYLGQEIAAGNADSPVLSPALTGTTIGGNPKGEPPRPGRRAPPPPNLHLDRNIMPSGLIQSSRPSVSDWAHGPDSEESPCTEELQLDPAEDCSTPPLSPVSPGSVKAGRERANKSMADLDFMTSALKK